MPTFIFPFISTDCKERAKVPRERVSKRGKAGQSDTSERSWEPGTRGTEGLASARRLRPQGMPMPYFRWTRLGQGPARTRGNETKRISRNREDYLMVLDIMARESYRIQGTIYSNRQTIVSYYNGQG